MRSSIGWVELKSLAFRNILGHTQRYPDGIHGLHLEYKRNLFIGSRGGGGGGSADLAPFQTKAGSRGIMVFFSKGHRLFMNNGDSVKIIVWHKQKDSKFSAYRVFFDRRKVSKVSLGRRIRL